ncbi:MAG: hypothetical protein V7723_17840 [Sneathiella sp.]|uniref:hypothetical protein n=1 Tax=Sneathiella sp. TaxID=1964365 RepID=UPI003001CC6F
MAMEICASIPGFDIDLYLETDGLSLCSILLGRTSIPREIEVGRLFMSGDALILKTMDRWFYLRTTEDPSDIMKLEEMAQMTVVGTFQALLDRRVYVSNCAKSGS